MGYLNLMSQRSQHGVKGHYPLTGYSDPEVDQIGLIGGMNLYYESEGISSGANALVWPFGSNGCSRFSNFYSNKGYGRIAGTNLGDTPIAIEWAMQIFDASHTAGVGGPIWYRPKQFLVEIIPGSTSTLWSLRATVYWVNIITGFNDFKTLTVTDAFESDITGAGAIPAGYDPVYAAFRYCTTGIELYYYQESMSGGLVQKATLSHAATSGYYKGTEIGAPPNLEYLYLNPTASRADDTDGLTKYQLDSRYDEPGIWTSASQSVMAGDEALIRKHLDCMRGTQTYELQANTGQEWLAGWATSPYESNAALKISQPRTFAVGRASETDSARAVDPTTNDLLIPVGKATETDTAGTVGRPRTFAVGQTSETDSALALLLGQQPLVHQAIETDSARSVYTPATEARGWSYGVGYGDPTALSGRATTELPAGAPDATAVTNPLVADVPYTGDGFYTVDDATGVGAAVGPDRIFVIEWDSYQEDAGQTYAVVWTNDDYTDGGTLWSNSGTPFSAGVWNHTTKILTTPPEATQVYFVFGGGIAYMSGLSIRSGPILNEITLTGTLETDTAQPLTVMIREHVPVGQATETDSALVVTFTQHVLAGQASETDSATAVTVTRRVAVGVASETDSAQALVLVVHQHVYMDQAVETDEAIALSIIVDQIVSVTTAVESDQAQLVTVVIVEDQTVVLGFATETDLARGLITLTDSPYVKVTHTYLRGDGTPAEGVVAFAPRFPMAEGEFPPLPTFTNRKVARIVDGELDISLLESDPDTTDPDAWTYNVTEQVDNMLLDYDAYVDFDPLIVDLRELTPAPPDDGVP